MGERKECMQYIRTLKYGMREEDICKYRTEYCVEWYTRKAIKYKFIFMFLSVVNIVLPQVSAIVVLKTECTVASAIFSSIVSCSAALLVLLDVKDRWIRYRTVAEYIKKEYTLYCIQKSPYGNNNPHAAYLCMLEQYMAEEQREWIKKQKETGTKKDE